MAARAGMGTREAWRCNVVAGVVGAGLLDVTGQFTGRTGLNVLDLMACSDCRRAMDLFNIPTLWSESIRGLSVVEETSPPPAVSVRAGRRHGMRTCDDSE